MSRSIPCGFSREFSRSLLLCIKIYFVREPFRYVHDAIIIVFSVINLNVLFYVISYRLLGKRPIPFVSVFISPVAISC